MTSFARGRRDATRQRHRRAHGASPPIAHEPERPLRPTVDALPTGWRQLDLAAAATLPVQEVLEAMASHSAGLSTGEAQRRLALQGPNALRSHGARPLTVLVRQLHNPLLLLLLAAALTSALVGERTDALIIFVISALSIGLGFVNEYRSERAVEALHSQLRHTTLALRDGSDVRVDVTGLVAGDVVRIGVGDVVPADLRLLESEGLECDEAALTGESLPAEKQAEPVKTPQSQLDLASCAFLGTVVRAGSGRGVVVQTGARTAFGMIAVRLGERQPQTAFELGLRSFSLLLVRVTAVLAGHDPRRQRRARPVVARLDSVRARDRDRAHAPTAARDRHGQPLHRCETAGQAVRDRQTPHCDRGPRQHRGVVHGQDRHAHRGPRSASLPPSTPPAMQRPSPSAWACCATTQSSATATS